MFQVTGSDTVPGIYRKLCWNSAGVQQSRDQDDRQLEVQGYPRNRIQHRQAEFVFSQEDRGLVNNIV